MKKAFIPTAVFASLILASATALAAVHTTGDISEPASLTAANVSAAAVTSNTAGTVEYARKTLYNPDGSLAAIDETWADVVTHNQRSDYTEPAAGTDSMQRVGGAYVLDNGHKYLKVATNDQGNLVGYELTAKSAEKQLFSTQPTNNSMPSRLPETLTGVIER